MKLKPVGSNQTELEKDSGVTVFFSYQTPVAVFVPGKGALVTSKHYSRTTSKHIGLAIRRWGANRTEVDQGVIDSYANDTAKPEPSQAFIAAATLAAYGAPKSEVKSVHKAYQPKTGQKCHCKRGVERDNCPDCEGTGMRIDFAAIRARA